MATKRIEEHIHPDDMRALRAVLRKPIHINDSKGHQLKAARRLLSQVYRRSPVFRIGGDEFVILLQRQDYDEREALLEEIKKQVLQNKKNGEVVIAVGMAEYEQGKSALDVFERADQEMYKNKKELKSE